MNGFNDMNLEESRNIFRRNERPDLNGELLNDGVENLRISQSIASESQTSLRNNISLREWLLCTLHSTKYQVFVVVLVVIDTLIVITELLLDLELQGMNSQVPHILHMLSIFLLCVFVIEILFKIYAYKLEFFKQKGEIFDAIVIIVALVLDIISLHSVKAMAGSGLIIVLRLWRIVRIQNSIVMSVKRAGEKQLLSEREIRKLVESELEFVVEKNNKLRYCCRELLVILKDKGIISPSLKYSLTELEIII